MPNISYQVLETTKDIKLVATPDRGAEVTLMSESMFKVFKII